MSPSFSKRGYLLPKGCKDLVDAVNWKGNIFFSETTTIGEVAALLGQEPFNIIARLKLFGIFATVKQVVDFETLRKVAREFGYAAKLVDSRTMRKLARGWKYAAKRPA